MISLIFHFLCHWIELHLMKTRHWFKPHIDGAALVKLRLIWLCVLISKILNDSPDKTEWWNAAKYKRRCQYLFFFNSPRVFCFKTIFDFTCYSLFLSIDMQSPRNPHHPWCKYIVYRYFPITLWYLKGIYWAKEF